MTNPRKTELLVFSVTAPNTVCLNTVDFSDGPMTKSKFQEFIIGVGQVDGFDVHPSKDYILITSNRGSISIFRTDTGELRGTIKVPEHARGACIDPSGLYVITQVPT